MRVVREVGDEEMEVQQEIVCACDLMKNTIETFDWYAFSILPNIKITPSNFEYSLPVLRLAKIAPKSN